MDWNKVRLKQTEMFPPQKQKKREVEIPRGFEVGEGKLGCCAQKYWPLQSQGMILSVGGNRIGLNLRGGTLELLSMSKKLKSFQTAGKAYLRLDTMNCGGPN